MKTLLILLTLLVPAAPLLAEKPDAAAAEAINALGIDLLHRTARADANALLSPYSIQEAMAMVCAGADGETREEMVRVLHYPKDQGQVDRAFAAFQADLAGIVQQQAARNGEQRQDGVANEPLVLTTANRLFGQAGYDFRPSYLNLLKDTYQSPFEPMDFARDASGATANINRWVGRQTHERIQNVIPAGALNRDTRLVLVNAIYLNAPWLTVFDKNATRPRTFHLPGGGRAKVPTMYEDISLGYAHPAGYQVVVVPYAATELQFVILLPDKLDGLAALEARLTPKILADCASLPNPEVKLFLPKFKLEPPSLSLAHALKSLGMKHAFDLPPGSANFDRIAPRHPNDYLYISDVYHKTFFDLDESRTEAAAATAVAMPTGAALEPAPPPPVIEVHVDHPFLFAIQHRDTGACLFLGHVTDP
jgi:serpin B